MLKQVLVLGSGFTRAFYEDAPLMVADYDADRLGLAFKDFAHAFQILEAERARHPKRWINIETLMTRLDGGMSYDRPHGAHEQLQHLLVELRRSFVLAIEKAKKGANHSADLGHLAAYCLSNSVNCITFNYDDLFDAALAAVPHRTKERGSFRWTPDGGYGFACKPAEEGIIDVGYTMDETPMLLLKLHGSLNWRPRIGSKRPYNFDAVVHFEDWRHVPQIADANIAAVARHLQPDPFIVPPVLQKSNLAEEPILQLIWAEAYRALSQAERVIFAGYSLPLTDVAGRSLFVESLAHLAQEDIAVVNHARNAEEQDATKLAYRALFPKLQDNQFRFDGALRWSQEFIATPAR
jgi:hypothetical protein